MIVLFDAKASGSGAASGGVRNVTFSVGANTNRILIVSVNDAVSGSTVSGVTYNGVAMTLGVSQVNSNNNSIGYIFYLIAPSTGSNTLAISISNSTDTVSWAISSYYQASQTSQPNSTSSIFDANLTPSNPSSSSLEYGYIIRLNSGVGTPGGIPNNQLNNDPKWAGDNGMQTTAQTISSADSSAAILALFINPLPDFYSVSVSDTTTVSNVSNIGTVYDIRVSDTTTVSDSDTVETSSSNFGEENTNITTSNYKWMTSTLLTAQQKYNVRPNIKCLIVDDTVQPNQIINNGGTESPTAFGSAVTAPDGSLLAAGFDNGNNISFFKAANIHATNGAWDVQTTLDSSGTSIQGGNSQRIIISCSDWINGSYHIDVFFFNNFGNSGGNLNVIQKYSDDGGITWNTRTNALDNTPNTSYGGNPNPKNLSLCAFKPRLVSGVLRSAFAWIRPDGVFPNSYDIVYTYFTGSGYTSQTKWSQKNVNSVDWTLHSLDSFYLNGTDYIVFSGYRNFIDKPNATNPNFSIWVTSLVAMTASVLDIWSAPVSVFSTLAATNSNQNSYIYPVATVTSGAVNLLFRAVTVASVSQSAQGSSSTIVTTVVNYMLAGSADGVNFTYPSIVVFTDGTQFNDSGGGGAQTYNSYTNQGNYYYILGSGKLWEFVQNNIIADVTNYVVKYSVQDTAGQSSSVQLQISNQDNIWVGSSPTGTGAAAIAKGKKIIIDQGYYNASGDTETVPRDVYYIDDINQSVTSSNNDVSLVGRDFYKKMSQTITKYSYGWLGPYLYADIFDGTTTQNWSQFSGSWLETGGAMTTTSAQPFDAVITLNGVTTTTYGSFMSVNIMRNTTGTQHVYAMFIDSDNYLRLEITDGAWAVVKRINGSSSTLDSATFSLSSSKAYTIFVRRYDYYKYNFMLGDNASVTGNPLDVNVTVYLYGHTSTPVGEYDLSSDLTNLDPQTLGVGLGSNGWAANFQFLRYSQFEYSNSISDLVKSLASKSGVTRYEIQNTIQEDFTTTASYSGTFTTPNNTLVVAAGNRVINTSVPNKIANGEILFQSKITPANSASSYGFSLVFRSTNAGDEYRWHIKTTATGGYQSSQFERLYSTVTYVFPAQMSNVTANLPGTVSGNNNMDLTVKRAYRLVMVDGWMYGFIDGVMVNAWNDNNTTVNYLTNGFWGWAADSNTTLTVYNMSSAAFWKQVQQFSLNPGDDILNAVSSLIQTVRGWFFSNIMGTFKVIFLDSDDPSTYTYQNQISAQGVDISDKEYVSQVTVYGNNVSATARDTTLMAGVPVREEVIVDYQILTQDDAQTRADFELTNANQFQSQYIPKQIMNVGAELFDVVTVVNTGDNSSGVSSTGRVYAQKMDEGGASGEYSVEVDTGNVGV